MTDRERFDWAGDASSVAEVAGELARLHAESMGPRGPGHGASRTLTLIVAPGAEDTAERRLAQLRARLPSRTIVLHERSEDGIVADVRVECMLAPGGGPGLCTDRVTLAADAGRLAHADSLVAGLLVPGLPVAAWLGAGEHSPAAEALTRLADVVYVDTATAPDPRAALRDLRGLTREHVVVDVTWGELAPWRRRIAGTFDPPDRRSLLARVDGVEVRHAPDAEAAALLLAGWLAARGGWPVDEAVRLVQAPGARSPIEQVSFRAGGERVMCASGGMRVPRGEALVAALGPVGARPPGYDAALEALAA